MKVFYDDKCNICKKEINYYKKLNVKNINWIGIHENKEKLDLKGLNKENYLKIFHIIDDNNELRTGVEAFIALWKKYKYLKYLAYLINFYPIKIFANIIYNIFAQYRYNKLYRIKK